MCINFKNLIRITFILILNNLHSQTLDIAKNIKTIILNNSKSTDPFFSFDDNIELSFDDLDSDEKNYYYQINHFDYNWKPSKLLKSEYLNGFDDLRIRKYRNSFNTLKSYTNYKLKIPNNDLSLKFQEITLSAFIIPMEIGFLKKDFQFLKMNYQFKFQFLNQISLVILIQISKSKLVLIVITVLIFITAHHH